MQTQSQARRANARSTAPRGATSATPSPAATSSLWARVKDAARRALTAVRSALGRAVRALRAAFAAVVTTLRTAATKVASMFRRTPAPPATAAPGAEASDPAPPAPSRWCDWPAPSG